MDIIVEWIDHKVLCHFLDKVLCSTLDLGPWIYNMSLVFFKLIDVKRV